LEIIVCAAIACRVNQGTMGKSVKNLGALVFVKHGRTEHPAHLVLGSVEKEGMVEVRWCSNNICEYVSKELLSSIEGSRASRSCRRSIESAPTVSTRTSQSFQKKKPVPTEEPVHKKKRLVKYSRPQLDENKTTTKIRTDKSEATIEGVRGSVDEAALSSKDKAIGDVETRAIPREKDNTANQKVSLPELLDGSDEAYSRSNANSKSGEVMMTKSTFDTPAASVDVKKPQSADRVSTTTQLTSPTSTEQTSKMDDEAVNNRSKERKRDNLTGPQGTSLTRICKPALNTNVMDHDITAPKDADKAESTSRKAGPAPFQHLQLKDNVRDQTGKARASEPRKDVQPAKKVSQAASSAQKPQQKIIISLSSDDSSDCERAMMMSIAVPKVRHRTSQTAAKSEGQLKRSVQTADGPTTGAERTEGTVSTDHSATQSTGQASKEKQPLDVPHPAVKKPTDAVQRPHADGKKRRVEETACGVYDGEETASKAEEKAWQMGQPEALPSQLEIFINSTPAASHPPLSLAEWKSEASNGRIVGCVEEFYNWDRKDHTTVGDIVALVEGKLEVELSGDTKFKIQQYLHELVNRDAEQAR
jgi:hypothetical protein